jgi:hypothetical protein
LGDISRQVSTIPPHGIAERLGHDGMGLLDLSVLTGAALVHHSPLTVW